ncbi:DUF6090 family protein [Winogradskyella alexanderae]|uniref:Uncharacterized protein n=1 Tax=Winogradskyella alexanderae TaxID=2877123 RepID=A0ABS7XT85_9FLAO|nr:DUF6090 family protein [Winogradskyella alexanderae]MCA0133233.1 hypothetical protein [Winogradskyella alexanderae]
MENKTGKYLKYAIGEIILVVIGILIALQINNWNEQRKANKQELLLLKQLQIDINSNLNEVVELNERLNINKVGIDSLSARLNKKHYDIMVPVFLSQALRKSDFNYASSGYNLMQNGKASLISDEAILKSVLSLYENDFPDIITRQNEMKNGIDIIQRNFINKLFVKSENDLNIKFNEFDEVATDLFAPIDYYSLTENIEFKNILIQLGKLVEVRLAYLNKTEGNLNKTTTLLNSKFYLE